MAKEMMSLGMTVWVIDQKPFGHGGGVEIDIRGEQGQGRSMRMDFDCSRELHRVIAPQGVSSCQRSGLFHECGRDLDNEIDRHFNGARE
jgi:hypothetical protein